MKSERGEVVTILIITFFMSLGVTLIGVEYQKAREKTPIIIVPSGQAPQQSGKVNI